MKLPEYKILSIPSIINIYLGVYTFTVIKNITSNTLVGIIALLITQIMFIFLYDMSYFLIKQKNDIKELNKKTGELNER